LILTKLDHLDPLAAIPVGVDNECDGIALENFPADLGLMTRAKVRYQVLPDGKSPTYGIKDYGPPSGEGTKLSAVFLAEASRRRDCHGFHGNRNGGQLIWGSFESDDRSPAGT